MKTKWICFVLALLLLYGSALAESYTGVTAAGQTKVIEFPSEATTESVMAEIGDRVTEGQELAVLRQHSVFADEDGTAVLLEYKPGDYVDGTVMKVVTAHLFHIYGTIKEGYNQIENKLIHTGEILYAKCTKDGSHRGTVVVQSIDKKKYEAFSVGGQLYIGETVYLYRDENFDATSRVGIATVVGADPLTYECKGYVSSIDVADGEGVQRGEKLYSWCEAESPVITAPEDGIITAVGLEIGQSSKEGSAFEYMPSDALRIDFTVSETELEDIKAAKSFSYLWTDSDGNEVQYPAELESISLVAESNVYRVRLIPDNDELPIGLHLEVVTE